MGTLEYNIQVARLQAEINVLHDACIEYADTFDLVHIEERLKHVEYKLNRLVASQIPL